MEYDLTHKDGKPYVMIPFHEYRAMEKNGAFGDGTADMSDALPNDLVKKLQSTNDHPIKTIRKHQGLTQQVLAEKADISRPFLTEIETGKKNGSIKALKQIAAALCVSVDTLVK
jgi:DNA-binding XRE family transcriptional regulator